MRIGISMASSYNVTTVRDGARYMLERAKAAADAGLDSLFMGDHHVTPGPYYQNTPILARALAAWRADAPAGALYLLPFRHPVLLAEEIATVACMMPQRFIMQCAIGYGDREFAAFGINPKLAMLSYSSGTSGKGREVEKVRKATQIAKDRRPDLLIEGPIQYDAAVDPRVAAKKMPDSNVAGQASVLIFPDLNTGNNTYKAVQRETGAIAIGPILQGLNRPVNDLSRGSTVDDVINTIVITAIQAQIEARNL